MMNPFMSKPSIDRKIDIPGELIRELLTDSETRMVKQRLAIIKLLEEGHPVRYIAEQVQVGTDTVVRTARKLETNPKIREFLQRNKSSTASKWIFGQVDAKEEL